MNIVPPKTTPREIGLNTAEIQSLLHLLPQAALVLDTRNEEIAIVNHALSSLSGYSASQLAGQPLEMLLPYADTQNALGDLSDLCLHTQNGETIAVKLQRKPLANFSWWAILTIDAKTNPTDGSDLVSAPALHSLTHRLHELGTFAWPKNLESGIQQALAIARLVSGANVFAFYQVEPSKPSLKLAYVEGQAQDLPKQISLRELANLNQPQLWTPSQRPILPLHRTARNAHMNYVASAPVGEGQAQIGLILSLGSQPSNTLALPTTMVLARHVGNLIENHGDKEHTQQIIWQQGNRLAQYEKIHDTLQDGIILLSGEGRIESINAYCEQMLGYANHEVVDRPLEDILIGKENWASALDIARRMGYTHDVGVVSIYRRDGQHCQVQVRVCPLSGEINHSEGETKPNGVLNGWGILLQDISQQEQYRQRSQQLEQRAQLGEVTAIFAHEVRNPINNISTGLQLMAMNLDEDDPRHPQIQRMQQDCDRLTELMKSVLAFPRPQEYQLAPLEVGPVLARLLERWQPRLSKVNIRYELLNEAELPPILGDVRALEQVFTNLIHNAMQAMDEKGGHLTVRNRLITPESGGRYVEINFTDNGPGIPEGVRERIFEPFFTTRETGTGLGLAITKQIVTAHRGSIAVTSVPGGTAFRVLLPAHKSKPESSKETL